MAAVFEPQARAEIVPLQTVDGTEIAALFGRALSPTGQRLMDYSRRPTVMYFYAGGHTLQRSEPVFDAWRRLGVNVIVPEYPGYGLSRGKATERGCYAAADAVYRYLVERPDIDTKKILAAGWSVGGSVAVNLASRESLAGLILLATSTRTADVARIRSKGSKSTAWMPGWAISALTAQAKLDSLAKIPAVTCPILMINGENDDLVLREMADRLAAAAPGRVQRHVVPGVGHGDLIRPDDTELWNTLRVWVKSLD